MICPKCGKDIEDAKFCPECGTPLDTQQDEAAAEETVSAVKEDASSAEQNAVIEPTTSESPESEQPVSPSETSDADGAAPQGNEQENANKKKKRLKVCLGAVIALVIIMFLIGFVRGVQLKPAEKAQVQKVTTAIEVLPKEITLDNADEVEGLMKQYRALTEKQQKKVKNRNVLLKADETIDDLKVKEVEDAISAIGTVTADSENVLENAEDLYDALPEDLKERVPYDSLEKAWTEYDTILVEAVKKKIDSIGTVSLNSEELLDEIEEDYEQLSKENQALVTNYDIYTKAVAQYKKLQEERGKEEEQARKKAFADAVKGMRKKVDEVTDNIWYFPKSFPNYIDTRSHFLPYLNVDSRTGEVFLRLEIDYTGDEWVFWKKVTIRVDGTNYYMNFSNVNRDNDSGDVWEYVDLGCNADHIRLLRNIANSEKTLVRFEGDMHQKDIIISEDDKASIRSVLNAYDVFYGN